MGGDVLPTGIVTLLLADVEGSTRLWDTQPDQMTTAFAALDRALAESIAAHGGVRPVEQGEGDSFVLAFRRATDAVACALDLQQAPLTPIKLRIGVHTGEVQLRDEGNYIGATINKTARVRDLGHGGQTLLTAATEEMVADRIPLDAWLTDLGTYSLRGVARPERIVQLCHANLRNDFPPLRAADSVATHNLPAQITTFIGRGDQIKQLRQVLAANRLVTLTGAGGAGKTRLSLEIAEQTAADFRDGVWFVDLAPIVDAEQVARAMVRALGFPDRQGRSTVQALLRIVGDRELLMVLDNCEHLLEECASLVNALVGACPGLTVLATSREPIGVAGEVNWRVPSLSIADEAVELFADRARRARFDFEITEHNRATVTEICERLDGMPLAIELAAARVRSMSLLEILDGLHDRFRLLTGGGRASAGRQQTLRACVSWSHELLEPSECVLFRRLGIFTGGFDLDAALAVVGDTERYQLLDQLTLLVDKSLVVAEISGERMRYRMLETVRQYALERLADAGEVQAVRKRCRDHYVAMVDKLASLGKSNGQSRAGHEAMMTRGLTEFDNLRAAFAWSVDLDPDPEVLIRAARGAAWLIDLPLADRLAETAQRAGGGCEAALIRAHALSFLNHGEEADAVLAAARSETLTADEHAALVFQQALNRMFTLADPAGARRLVDDATGSMVPDGHNCIAAFTTVYRALMGRPASAREAMRNYLVDDLPAVAARATSWASTIALGDAGATAEAVAAAQAGYPIPVRGYFVITDAHVGALVLAGWITDALDIADSFRRRAPDFSSATFDPIFAAIAGRAAAWAGQLHTAISFLESASKTFAALSETHGWLYRLQLPRAMTLAMTGLTGEAEAAMAMAEQQRHPSWRYLDYECRIAEAWLAASRGAVDEAVTRVLFGAETAGANGQFAAEVLCRQVATQFGDASSADRLRELADRVDGPRAEVTARFAVALQTEDVPGLAMASDDYAEMGDLVASMDAAAHAALLAPKSEYAAQADELAEQCGAITPALQRVRSTGR